jgi:hypothetical protein
MPKFDRQYPARSSGTPQLASNQKDPDDLENEKWTPTPAKLADFFARDMELARTNVVMALRANGRPSFVKDVKESSLHSIDTIERTLTALVKAGQVTEEKGRYSLVVP